MLFTVVGGPNLCCSQNATYKHVQASSLTEGGLKERLRPVELFEKSDCEIATSVNVKLEW